MADNAPEDEVLSDEEIEQAQGGACKYGSSIPGEIEAPATYALEQGRTDPEQGHADLTQ